METQVRALAHQQVKAGHVVTVITATPGRSPEESDGTVGVIRITAPVPGDLPVHPRARAAIAARLSEIKPDVVHVHLGEISPFAWGGVRAVRQLGLPRVATVHSVWSPLMRGLLAPLGRTWARSPTVMSAVSGMSAERVSASLGVEVHVLPNGIDTDVWHPRAQHAHSGVRFIAVQRLAPRKRTGALVRAFAAASSGDSSMHLEVIGDGPARARLERRVRAWGREDAITFRGRVTPEEIRAAFAGSDVFVQASRRESFGIAALEARASGLPVIAYGESGTADFITSDLNGILVSDDAELARAIGFMGRDASVRSRLTAYARIVPVEQSWQTVVPGVDDLYARAVSAIRLPR
jgi:glycosyltransferase involved in cell wall biosynthesis